MSQPELIPHHSIFAVVPEPTDTAPPFRDPQYVASAPLPNLLDATYFELCKEKLHFNAETLKVWESRISLLLFTGQLPAAKREAIALNNALYRAENPVPVGSGPGTQAPGLAGSGGQKAQTAPTRPNLSSPPSAVSVLPLPNNNNGHIPDSLLMLLLSLKCAPGLARAHELYRLCYQKRLRGDKNHTQKQIGTDKTQIEKYDTREINSDLNNTENRETRGVGPEAGTKLQGQLAAQAYAVTAALLVSRNFATLQSFLASLRSDIQGVITRKKTHEGVSDREEKTCAYSEIGYLQAYYSNITLLFLLVKVYARRAPGAGAGAERWGALYQAELAHISDHTWDALRFVMGNIAPQIGGEHSPLEEARDQQISVGKLADLVASDHISIRTICCLLAVWSLAATQGAHLSAAEFAIPPSDRETSGSKLDQVYGIISRKWSKHFNHLYGLE